MRVFVAKGDVLVDAVADGLDAAARIGIDGLVTR
jgi:hypothetical protein